MNCLTETEKAYLAGIVDGEGCIHVKVANRSYGSPDYQLQIIVVQADEDFLKYWKNRTGLGFIYHRPRKTTEKYAANCAETFTWQLNPKDSYDLLLNIRQYLMMKQPQADLAIELQKTRNKKLWSGGRVPRSVLKFREGIRQEIMALNKKHRPYMQNLPAKLGIPEAIDEPVIQLSFTD